MHALLSSKLLNSVYATLLDHVAKSNSTHHLPHKKMAVKIWNIKAAVLPWIDSLWTEPLHQEDATYVRLEIARELVEVYYRRQTFPLGSYRIHILNTFLKPVPFGTDVVVRRNLHALEIMVGPDKPGMFRYSTTYDFEADVEEVKAGGD